MIRESQEDVSFINKSRTLSKRNNKRQDVFENKIISVKILKIEFKDCKIKLRKSPEYNAKD